MTTRRQMNLGLVSLLAPLMGASFARGATSDDAAFPRWLASLEAQAGGRLGVAVLDTRTGEIVGHRLDERFPMCSTFKALAAAAVLARVDRGQDQLDRRVKYSASFLVPYSPVTKEHADRDGMALADICAAAVTLSDNTAGNLMLEAIGGPPALTTYLRGIGDEVSRLDRTEPTLNEARPGDPRDTSTPRAMTRTLRRLVLGDALKPASRAMLKRWLVECRTGDARLRAGLGHGWMVGDKTGTSNNAATANDVGVLWPPAGRAAGDDGLHDSRRSDRFEAARRGDRKRGQADGRVARLDRARRRGRGKISSGLNGENVVAFCLVFKRSRLDTIRPRRAWGCLSCERDGTARPSEVSHR